MDFTPQPTPNWEKKVVHRGLEERQAKTLAKSLNKKKPGHIAVKVGWTWDVIREGYA